MKSILLFGVLSFSVFGMKAFSQSTTTTNTTTTEPSTTNLMVNQASITVVDENPGADAPVDGYVFNENGELVKSKVQTNGKKIIMKKADYDVLPVEKQTYIKEDQASFIIIE